MLRSDAINAAAITPSALSTRITRRQLMAGASAAALALLSLSGAAGAAAAVDTTPSPVTVRVGRVSHAGADFRAGEARGVIVPSLGGAAALTSVEADGQYVSQPVNLEFPATHVGLHWANEGDPAKLEAAVRFSRDGQAWSPWRAAQAEHHGREPSDTETYSSLVRARGAEWLQYRLIFRDAPGAAAVSRVGIAYLDAGISRSSGAARFNARRGPTALLDRVITREQWGADESIRFSDGRDLWPRAFVTPKLLVVHHTATDNEYADPAAEVRAIYTYHAVVQGFGDIGYHLLIDNRGQIYEGRRGRDEDPLQPGRREAVSANIVGGHVLGFNYGSAGIALLGNFVDQSPTDAALDTLSEALAFEAQRAGLDPLIQLDVHRMRGTSGDIFWRDQLDVVSGHRDCLETECPGDKLYELLPRLREDVVERLGAAGPGARLTRAPTPRNVWPGDLLFSWDAVAGATEFSTRLEGFRLSVTPDLIEALSGYTDDQQERWSEWTAARQLSMPVPPDANGSYTMMIRARDSLGREGRVQERRTYIVGRHVLVDNDDVESTRRSGLWQPATQPMNFNGAGYELSAPWAGPADFTWLLRAPEPGTYSLLACWTSDESRASSARYRALVEGVEQISTIVDQRERGGAWIELGQLSLSGGGVCEVRLTNDADGRVAADAVRMSLVSL